MRESEQHEIIRIFSEVAEKQAFLFPDPIEPKDFTPADERYLLSSMTFRGESRGGLMLAVPESLARELAANVLGADADDPLVAENLQDSLGEILNVTCGHLLTALYGDAQVFDLSVPMPSFLFASDAGLLSHKPGCFAFSVDGIQILLLVSFSGSDGEGESDALR